MEAPRIISQDGPVTRYESWEDSVRQAGGQEWLEAMRERILRSFSRPRLVVNQYHSYLESKYD